ncbi:PucR family transcriptional regulator [Nocardia cyriacigeorgica]|uniref:Putative transcriptional regulator n=1 Tax=Nocardia cyriacigeorgica (strain GUH-2) TaxID=1127134 RepID=H6R6T4_NOCCG|nr:helix-turn-helix domain-containing protein [Nocardia cyriacigeorgica]MBF6285730.1 helix-turn-helix domain-containing protein [Nocardia cyriacigeorgica]MBF6427801.1 helix-turn-helix domain-containing protein [Nocardia cyriacigeorgica]CCF63447.1 putative transcriptional regulator [Nocardia cyriacigeorgica GUH-2]BDT87095.1 transcriptional regulator [Nocardia cyriacigeorgica]BDU06584.1 transcriptional regulator [Nocardia cyriacigeorgica]
MSFSALDLSVGDNDTVLEIGGQPASVPLQNTDRVASRMVDYFATCVAPCRTLPGEQMRGDVTEVTRYCLALAAEMLDRRTVPDDDAFTEVRSAAAQWAREGVPLGTILRAYHEGVRIAFGLVTARAAATDVEEVLAATDLILELLEAISAAVADAYVQEQQLVAREHQTASQTLASALLSGRSHAALALQSGIPVAERYQVVALFIPPHPDERNLRVDTRVAARRKLRRVQSELAVIFESTALALLSPQGGTLLIPLDGDAELTDDVLVRLSAAAEVPVTAAMVTATTGEVPEAADQAHELLGLVRAGERPPGLYQMTDLAVEYQLTRGGPATRRIATILEPLDDHPELFATMRAYLRNDMNRQLTARQLYVHPNTVDYRLRRIAQLTTIDLATSAGISQASIALLARELDRSPGARP